MLLSVHPCGVGMEYLRHGKRARMQTWQADVEPVKVVWFRVPASNRFFLGPTWFRSQNYSDPRLNDGLGEQYDGACCGLDSGYKWYSGRPPAPYVGIRVCGTPKLFAEGGAYGTDTPVPIEPNGMGECCIHVNLGAKGGEGVGGECVQGLRDFTVSRGGEAIGMAESLEICGHWFLCGVEIPLTADPTNNLSLSEPSVVYPLTAGAATQITGIHLDGGKKQTIALLNRSAYPITLINDSSLSIAQNRLQLPRARNLVLQPEDSAIFWQNPFTDDVQLLGTTANNFPDAEHTGDLLAGKGTNWEILPLGTPGQVLTVDFGQYFGLHWATPAAPGNTIGWQDDVGHGIVNIGILKILTTNGVLSNGLTWGNPISGTGSLQLAFATGTNGGAVSTDVQTFAGEKSFLGACLFHDDIRVQYNEGTLGHSLLISKRTIGFPVADTKVMDLVASAGTGAESVTIELDATNSLITFESDTLPDGPQIVLRGFGTGNQYGQSVTEAGLVFARGFLVGGSFTGGYTGTIG